MKIKLHAFFVALVFFLYISNVNATLTSLCVYAVDPPLFTTPTLIHDFSWEPADEAFPHGIKITDITTPPGVTIVNNPSVDGFNATLLSSDTFTHYVFGTIPPGTYTMLGKTTLALYSGGWPPQVSFHEENPSTCIDLFFL
jgi:hypothetical protein